MIMETISYKKALLLFANYSWKVLVALSVGVTILSIAFNFDLLKKFWLLYITVVLLLTIFISLLLLINRLIKRAHILTKKETDDKTDNSIPDQLLDIVSKLPEEESVILSGAIDRYFHLYGYHEERIKLGNLLNENRDIKNQVTNLIDKLGWANYLKNLTDVAIININQGIALAEENLLFYWAAKGERHLAGIERHRGNETEFLKHMNKSKDYTKQIQDITDKNEMEGSLHLAEAKYFLEKKDLSKAEEEANKAMQRFSNDMRRKIKVYVVLGNVYLERKLWDQAYNTFKEGYDKSKGLRNDERAKNALGLAKIHLKPEAPRRFFKIDKAKNFLKEAESLKNSLKRHEIEEIETLLNGLP